MKGYLKKYEDTKIVAWQKWMEVCGWVEAHPIFSLIAGTVLAIVFN